VKPAPWKTAGKVAQDEVHFPRRAVAVAENLAA